MYTVIIQEQVDLSKTMKRSLIFEGAYMCATQSMPHDLRHCMISSISTHKRRHLERLRRDAALVMSRSVSALSTVVVVLQQTL